MSRGCITCSPGRSCDFHPEMKLFLIVDAGDFKMSGPSDYMDIGWGLIQEPSAGCPEGIGVDPPSKVGRYLGCEN
eukprot:9498961-Pyramimonas_sp.AAC.1